MRNKQHNQNQYFNKIYITRGEPYKGKIIIFSNKALSVNLNALPVPTPGKVALNDTKMALKCHQQKVTVIVGRMSADSDPLPGKKFHWFFTNFSPKKWHRLDVKLALGNRTSPLIARYTREPLNLICRQVPFMFCVAGGLI